MICRNALLFASMLLASVASAQPTVTSFTIDCGGGTSAGGAFTLSGTIGQHDASLVPAAAGGLTISGGFWFAVSTPTCRADFNHDGSLDPDDLSDYIGCYFTPAGGCNRADFNGDGNTDPDDLSDYISAYFSGC